MTDNPLALMRDAEPGAPETEDLRDAQNYLALQAAFGERLAPDVAEDGEAALARALQPRNALEAVLATQLVSLQRAASEWLVRASERTDSPQSRAAKESEDTRRRADLRLALETFRVVNRTAEILGRLQRGEQRQRITVEHVQVAEGGQVAIGCSTGGDNA